METNLKKLQTKASTPLAFFSLKDKWDVKSKKETGIIKMMTGGKDSQMNTGVLTRSEFLKTIEKLELGLTQITNWIPPLNNWLNKINKNLQQVAQMAEGAMNLSQAI